MSTAIGALYAGTSGFSYPAWRGGFYPERARPGELLRHYASRLPSVELNTTFRRLPSEEQLRRWAAETPAGFRFAVKMPGRITHAGRLALAGVFSERVRALGGRLGPLLVQLPPSRPRDDGFLHLLLGSLDPELRHAIELRHPSWSSPAVDAALAGAGAVRVGALEGASGFRYLRLREPPYDDARLRALAGSIRPLLEAGVDVYCYFKHQDEPTAPAYAERLLALVGRPG